MNVLDYAAIATVWYVLSARLAIGDHFHLSLTTRLLWPLFLVSMIPRNLRHAGFRAELTRKLGLLLVFAVLSVAAYNVAAYISTNVLIRFALTFPIVAAGGMVLLAGGAALVGAFSRGTTYRSAPKPSEKT